MNRAVTKLSAPTRRIRVLDLINTDKSAKELLDFRVKQVNSTGRYANAICCSSGPYADRLRAWGHRVHVIDSPRNFAPLPLLRAIRQTVRLYREHRIEIVHTHGSVLWLVGGVAALFCPRVRLVHQVHGFHHHDAMKPLTRSVYVVMQRLLACLSDELLFQNQADVDECRRAAIAPRSKCRWIGNGVQLAAFPQQEPPKNDPPVILSVARFEPVKNHVMLLDAAIILKDRGVAFRLQLVGDGELRSQCESWVERHGLKQAVTFFGYRDDVPALTAAADVCTLVSLKEGLPRAIIEAGACGRPIVATDVIGNRDTVIDGRTGFLVPLGDSAILADRLEVLLRDPALRAEMGERGREVARSSFDERVITGRIIEVYDRLVRPPTAQPRSSSANHAG